MDLTDLVSGAMRAEDTRVAAFSSSGRLLEGRGPGRTEIQVRKRGEPKEMSTAISIQICAMTDKNR